MSHLFGVRRHSCYSGRDVWTPEESEENEGSEGSERSKESKGSVSHTRPMVS